MNTENLGRDAVIRAIRKIPDYPEPGILFYDITGLLQDPLLFHVLIDLLTNRFLKSDIDVVAGLDARGFIIGAVLAYRLNVGFVPIRKKGKLPGKTVSASYVLEYGKATVEMHTDAVNAGDRVLLVDDLIATGGTMLAGIELIHKLGGETAEAAAILELSDLAGGQNIRAGGTPLFCLCRSDEL